MTRYPAPLLSERQWAEVTRILRAHGTKQADTLARRIDGQIAVQRARWFAHELKEKR